MPLTLNKSLIGCTTTGSLGDTAIVTGAMATGAMMTVVVMMDAAMAVVMAATMIAGDCDMPPHADNYARL